MLDLLWDYHTSYAWKVSEYGAFSVPYFPVFGLNTGKYGPEKTPNLDTFHAVIRRKVMLPFWWIRANTLHMFVLRQNLL